jgi:outer membrane cobalamin receptor
LARDVGQLDFNDFVSSVSLTDERVEGGNPDLRPQTDWSLEIGMDLRPGYDTGLTLNAFHRWVSDTADFTPVGPPNALVDAPGNIGDSRIFGMQAVARMPLPALRGAAVNLDVTWQHSEVTDPLTAETRSISEFQDVQFQGGFRQDLPQVSWGVSYKSQSATRIYLLREIDRERASPSLDVFMELPLSQALRLRTAVVSLLGQPEERERRYFEPDRRVGEYSAERSERLPGRWYQLSLSGSF